MRSWCALSFFHSSKCKLLQRAEALLHINVVDVNDCAPQFANDHYQFDISSETLRQRPKTIIGRVQATDKDKNDVIAYSLLDYET